MKKRAQYLRPDPSYWFACVQVFGRRHDEPFHALPKGFHRIRHYGLLANGNRPGNIAHARQLLALPARPKQPETPEAALEQPGALPRPCPYCGSRMIIIETFARGCEPKYRPTPPAATRIDTS